MRERERDQRALAHALQALGDGAGHEQWGPGPVGQKLIDAWQEGRCSWRASWAFDYAVKVASQAFMAAGVIPPVTSLRGRIEVPRKEVIMLMTKIAPVLLEAVWELHESDRSGGS